MTYNLAYRNGKYTWTCPKCAGNFSTFDAVDLVNHIIDHFKGSHE